MISGSSSVSLSSSYEENYVVLLPVFDDWEALGLVIRMLDHELARCGRAVSILIVDDSSNDPVPTQR